jgi:hypothetical protein
VEGEGGEMIRSWTAAMLLLLVAGTACTSGSAGTEPSDRTSSSVRASPVPSGVFVSANFHPKVTFRLTPELDDARDRAALVTVDGARSQAVNIMAVSEVYDPASGELTTPPGDLIAWLRANPYLHAGKPTATEVAGLPATRIDVRVTKVPPVSSSLSCAPGCLKLFQMGLDQLPLGRGGRARFIAVQTDSGTVIIEFAATSAGFDAFASSAQRLIDTVRFLPVS